ncbi:MAG: hypothetical protein Kow0074_25860 [Candidatus Zixiibacteriota bacterium]
MTDIIQQLGSLGFASRLKRLGERLQSDVSRVYKDQNVDFEARWFPVAFALRERSPSSVTEIADQLHLTHAAVSQITSAMETNNLVSSERDTTDERRRLLSLTEHGRDTLKQLEPIWNAVSVCTQDLIQSSGRDFLDILSRIETALDERDMYARVTSMIKQQQMDEVEIVDYSRNYRDDFGRINREWLEQYFEVEPHDAAVLDDPEGTILRLGGEIVFALLNGEVVGTAALLRGPNRHVELAKMGVASHARGKQVGRRLALHMIERARRLGATDIVLATSPKLTAALHLYRSLGFEEFEADAARKAQYKRYSIFMRLKLTPDSDRIDTGTAGRRNTSNA